MSANFETDLTKFFSKNPEVLTALMKACADDKPAPSNKRKAPEDVEIYEDRDPKKQKPLDAFRRQDDFVPVPAVDPHQEVDPYRAPDQGPWGPPQFQPPYQYGAPPVYPYGAYQPMPMPPYGAYQYGAYQPAYRAQPSCEAQPSYRAYQPVPPKKKEKEKDDVEVIAVRLNHFRSCSKIVKRLRENGFVLSEIKEGVSNSGVRKVWMKLSCASRGPDDHLIIHGKYTMPFAPKQRYKIKCRGRGECKKKCPFHHGRVPSWIAEMISIISKLTRNSGLYYTVVLDRKRTCD